MKISLLLTGKTEEGYIREGMSVYQKRLSHYISLDIKELTPPKLSTGLSVEATRGKEGQWLLNNLPRTDYLVILDEAGTELSSVELSRFLQARMNQGIRALGFLTGGAYGLSGELKQAAQYSLSLSRLTFTHQMSRLILLEQLYRAMTILKGEPYHNP